MKKQFLLLIFIALTTTGYSQKKISDKMNKIGISVPVIWNNSEATFYSGNKSSGKGVSYGINLNFERTIYKGIFAIVGFGYFKQAFHLSRPFKFDDPTSLLFTTKSYSYSNLEFIAGIGYKKELQNKISVKAMTTFNLLKSFKQKYIPQYLSNSSLQNSQNNNKSINIGELVNLNIGAEKQISEKISVGIDLLIPLSIHWNNDEIFYEYANYENTQQIAQNKFSIGISVSCNYHF